MLYTQKYSSSSFFQQYRMVNTMLWKHFVQKFVQIEKRVLEGELFSEHLRTDIEKESGFIIYIYMLPARNRVTLLS